MKRFFLIFALLFAVALVESADSHIWQKYGGNARMPCFASQLIIDPSRDMTYEELSIFFALYECLFVIDNSRAVGLNLAQSYTVDEDFRHYTVNLSRNARFHDGSPMKASDVINSINANLKRSGKRDTVYKNLIEIRQLSDYEIEFVLAESDFDFPRKLAHPFCAIVKGEPSVSTNGEISLTRFIGTGPFVYSQSNRSGVIRLSRNDYYHRGKSYLDSIEFVHMKNEDDSFIEFIMGNFDLHVVSYSRYRNIKDRRDVKYHETDGLDTLIVDLGKCQWRGYLIRSLDPAGLVRVTMNNAAVEISGILHEDDKKFFPSDFVVKSGKPSREIILGYMGEKNYLEPLAQSIASRWRSEGVDVKIQKISNPSDDYDVLLRIIKTLGQDTPFIWRQIRQNFGLSGDMPSPDDIFLSPEKVEERGLLIDGRFYPIARPKFVYAVSERVANFNMTAACVPDFWSISLN